jgi:putative PIN family toxin of toxin-antitoxin system
MGEKKVIIDTNVILSGFGWNGKARELLIKVIEEYEWYISKEQLEEIERVLEYPKLKNVSKDLLLFLEKNCIIIKGGSGNIDNMLIEMAFRENILLITGDKEMLQTKKCKLMSVSEFMNMNLR